MRKHIGFGLGLALAFAGASAASAANNDEALDAAAATTTEQPAATEPSPTDDRWEVTVAPYLWASAMKVDIATPQGENVEIDESFTDILGAIKFVFMGAVEARRGRFVTVTDLIFLSTGSETEGSIGPGLIEADTDMRTIVVTSVAGYRAVDKGPMYVDVMAGARLTSMRAELELTGPLNSVERESSKTKIGPVIAARAHVPFDERWGFGLYCDVGGFGITSDISWELVGTVQYDASEHWRLGAGWRHFVVHQDKGEFDIDLKLTGPFLTAAYRF